VRQLGKMLLDLLHVHRGLMEDAMVGGCLGHSNHEMVKFKIFSVMRKKDSRVHKCWSVCKNDLLEVQEWAIPLCHKLSKQGRKLAWVNRELKRKKKLYGLWKTG